MPGTGWLLQPICYLKIFDLTTCNFLGNIIRSRNMKHLAIIIVAGLMTVLNCRAQNGVDEKYIFLNWYIKHNNTYALSDSLIDFPKVELDGIKNLNLPDAELSTTDRQAMIRQDRQNKSIRILDTTLLKGVHWKANGKYKERTLITLPIFSIKRDVAIIYRKYYCGPLCGQDCMIVFVKKKGKWQNSKYDPPCVEY